MSGGHFDYVQYTIDQVADNLEQIINNPQEYDQYSSATIAEFRTGLLLLRQAAIYLHRIDYLISCDDDESAFHSRLQEDLNAIHARSNQSGTG